MLVLQQLIDFFSNLNFDSLIAILAGVVILYTRFVKMEMCLTSLRSEIKDIKNYGCHRVGTCVQPLQGGRRDYDRE